MKRHFLRLLIGLFLLPLAGSAWAAASCPLDSVLTFNIDSVLTEVTIYDAIEDTSRTTVWTVNPNGSRIGKSREESYSSTLKTMTASYEWDNTKNDWKGKDKFEYVYKYFGGKKMMISSTTFKWINSKWAADKRYTYDYDNSARETEYFEYKRNTTTNILEPVNGHVYEWLNDDQKTLEEIYTTYSNGAWSAGTKQEWAFDEDGRQTLSTFYGTITNGNWVGTSKEEWGYTDSVLTMTAQYMWANDDWEGTLKEVWAFDTIGRTTLHEQYGWYNSDWSMTLREIAAFDEAGHQTLIENYTGANGVPTGIKKEEYTYAGGDTLILSVTYKWSATKQNWINLSNERWEYNGPNGEKTYYEKQVWRNSAWGDSIQETWEYNGPDGKQTLHERYSWNTTAASMLKTLEYTDEYDSDGHLIRKENYTFTNGVKKGVTYYTYTYVNGKKTAYNVYAWDADLPGWVGDKNETWYPNASKPTLHEKYIWEGSWVKTLEENTTYSGSYKVLVENYALVEGVWTGTQKDSTTYSGTKKTEHFAYAWENGAWVNDTKETWTPSSSKPTLHEQYKWDGSWTKTLEENTTYEGTNKILVENYALIEGVWTGTEKEKWTYESGHVTIHEQYAWDGDWIITLQENTAYEGANKVLVENYALIEGVWTGTEREGWGYTSGRQTLHETYEWYNNMWSLTLRDIVAFDEEGNQILVESYTGNNGSVYGVKKEEYVFAGGKKIQTIKYSLSNGVWVYSTKNEIGYQDGDTEVSEANYTWNGSAWNGSGNRTFTTRDEENRVVELLIKNWPEGASEWTNDSIVQDTYNEEGENIRTYKGTWNGSRWVMYYMTRLEQIIDEKGRQLLKATWECDADSVWKGIQKDTAAYSVTDKQLYVAQFKTWKNNDWVPVYKVEYTYDAADNVILNERKDWKNNNWQGNYRYEYAYDAKRRQISYTSYTRWNSSTKNWIGSSKQECTYYGDGQLYATKTTYRWSNNKWAPLFKYTYTYDASDREIDQLVESYSGGSWYNDTRYITEYRGSKKVKFNEYIWWNNEWLISSCDESYYDADEQAKLRRERQGTWSLGTLSTYSDKHYDYACDPRIIRFVNYDGTPLQTDTLYKGAIPNYIGEEPTRTDEGNTYVFIGWTPEIATVTGNATYTATFSSTINQYTITFQDEDGTILSSQLLDFGATPTCAEPTKDADAQYTYSFAGWSPEIKNVTKDATYIATYNHTLRQYSVTFKDEDGSTLDSRLWDFGATPTCSEPTKESTAEYTYSFAGWSPTVIAVNGEATYTATYTQSTRQYTITFKNEDGSTLDSRLWDYNATPSCTEPTKDPDAQYTYSFAGWSPAIETVSGEATYVATYSSTVNQYTITFKDEDGAILDSRLWVYNATPSCTEPTKDPDAQYTYTFAGWSPAVTTVTGEATYVATYSSTVNQYTITFKDEDGTILDSRLWDYGATPSCAEPTKAADAHYTYTFSGWSPAVVAVTGEATYVATYSSTVNQYTITFKDEDGTVLDSRLCDYGATPSCTEPTKAADAHYTYTFSGWSPAVVAVTGEATYVATYSSTVNQYTVTFKDEDGTILDSRLWDYGATPTCTEPTKAADAQYSYSFTGWTPAIETVSGEATYIATYSSTVNQYTITFKDEDGAMLDSRLWDYGATPTCTEPTKQATDEYTYTFSGWSPAVVSVTGIATYTATYSATKNSYTITWLDDKGTEIDQTTVEFGLTPTHADIDKESTAEYSYIFAGWSPTIVPVTGNATYQASFTETKRTYTITFYYENGTTILDQVMAEYGAIPTTSLIPSMPSDAHYSYTFAGWEPEVVPVTGDASYIATYTAIPNKYTITFKNYNGRVLERTKVEYGATPEYEGETPYRPASTQCVYNFIGWSPEIEVVSGDATYTAVFEGIINTYTIIFYDEDGITELDRTTVEHGQKPTTDVVPTKPDDEGFTYTFVGWNPKIVKATADANYIAVYNAKPKDLPEGVQSVGASEQVTKVVIDGQIYILRGGKTYTIHGQLVEK